VPRLVVIPLSFLRRLDSLKYTSVVALVSIGYLVILIVYHFTKGDTMEDRGPIRIVEWGSLVQVLQSFPVIVFAYTCHQNVGRAYILQRTKLTATDVLDTERDQRQFATQVSFPIC
jgi:amino acid permease